MTKMEMAFAEELGKRLLERIMEPHRAIAEEEAAALERTFVGEDADLQGYIGESHLVFGTMCAYSAAEKLAELELLFDRMWAAQMKAINHWREYHPGNDLVMPDGPELTEWLVGFLPTPEDEAK